MTYFWKLLEKLHGENLEATPKTVIVDQMNEPRALPMGRTEFEVWSDRIISGALLHGGKEDPEVFRQSQKFALANALMHIGPTESHKPDAHFIHGLRVAAIKQVALERAQEIRAIGKARAEAEAKADEEKGNRLEVVTSTEL